MKAEHTLDELAERYADTEWYLWKHSEQYKQCVKDFKAGYTHRQKEVDELKKELSDTKANLQRAYKGFDEIEQVQANKRLKSKNTTLKRKLREALEKLVAYEERDLPTSL